MLANRRLASVLLAPLRRRNYRALRNMYRLYPSFVENLYRYVLERGAYPYDCAVRTPAGTVTPRLYSLHDLLTLNEVFCREDYRVPAEARVVVDVGANIGISALYFLTRNREARCHLYEPVPNNVQRLRHNLAAFEDRYVLNTEAVANFDGLVSFGTEPTGRYGGIGAATGHSIEVRCRDVNAVLRDVLAVERLIDVLKIDTEGSEEETVRSIAPDVLERIGRIYFESPHAPRPLHGTIFDQRFSGNICVLTNRR